MAIINKFEFICKLINSDYAASSSRSASLEIGETTSSTAGALTSRAATSFKDGRPALRFLFRAKTNHLLERLSNKDYHPKIISQKYLIYKPNNIGLVRFWRIGKII